MENFYVRTTSIVFSSQVYYSW